MMAEKTVLFVGEKRSGKTSLIAKFLDEPVKDDMKETTALDYRYGTRIKEEKKQKVNIYELGKYHQKQRTMKFVHCITDWLIIINFNCIGGGRVLSSMLEAPLNPFNIGSTCACITIDLSEPGNAIDSLKYWISAIREHSQSAFEKA